MKRLLKYWYILPILLACLMIVACLMYMLMIQSMKSSMVIESTVSVLILIVLIALPISWVILLINKQWKRSFFSFLATILVVCVLGFPLSFLAMESPDGFGKDHPIPDGLECNLPLVDDSCSTAPIDSIDTNNYLVVWNSFQGGVYKYDFYYGPLPAGEVFLRCFEVTENIPLSEDEVEESSKVCIDSTKSFTRLVEKKEFHIYEGDWGDYYAARVEVWYRNGTTKQERKLLEKVYRVEGWMR